MLRVAFCNAVFLSKQVHEQVDDDALSVRSLYRSLIPKMHKIVNAVRAEKAHQHTQTS